MYKAIRSCGRSHGQSYGNLQEIEDIDKVIRFAARVAWEQARDAYLAYRRQGGYAAQGGGGQLVDHVLGLDLRGKRVKFKHFSTKLPVDPDYVRYDEVVMRIVVTILNGSRDKALGDDPA